MTANIRKIGVWIEETHQEGGKRIDPPTRKAVAAAVIENPFAGEYVEDLSPLMEIGADLGGLLGEKCVAALGIAPEDAESYGKAAMVGANGELEHAAALLHPKMGAPLRKAVEKGAALVPSSKKRGGMGAGSRRPLGTQGRGLCPVPFRRDRDPDQRCAPGERDPCGHRCHRQRAAPATGRRADGGRGRGERRASLG